MKVGSGSEARIAGKAVKSHSLESSLLKVV